MEDGAELEEVDPVLAAVEVEADGPEQAGPQGPPQEGLLLDQRVDGP